MPLTAHQRDVLTRTVLGEAANQGVNGMAAVASVIRNRANSGQFSNDPADVALQHAGNGYYQFSANADTAHGGNNIGRNAGTNSRAYQRAAAVVDQVFNDEVPDPTGGALYYHTADVNPGWDNHMYQTAHIGAHIFYSPSPVPPSNVPMVGSAYADSSLPPAPIGDPRSPALSAIDAATAGMPTDWTSFYHDLLPRAAEPQIASQADANDFYRGFGLEPGSSGDVAMADLSAITPNQSSSLYLPPAMDAYYGPNGEPPVVPTGNAATLGATQTASLPPTDGLSQIAALNPLEGAGYLAALNPSQTLIGRDITGLPFDQTGYMSDEEANSFHGDPAYDEGTTPLPRADPRGYAAPSVPLPRADPRGGLSDLMQLLGAEPAHPTGVSLPDVPPAGPNAPYDVSYGTPPQQSDVLKGAIVGAMSHPGNDVLQPAANALSGIAGWLGSSGSATPAAAAAPVVPSNSGHSDTSWDDLVNSFSIPTAPTNSGTSSMARNGVTSAAARNAGPGADLASLSVSPSVSVPKYITISKQVPVPSNQPIATGSGVHWDDAAGNFVLDAAPKAAAPTYRTQQVQVLNPKYVAPPVAQPAPVVPLSPPQDELARLRDEQQNPFQSLFSNSLFGKALGFGDVLNNGGLHYGTTPGLLTRLVGGIAGMGNSGIAAAPAVDLYHGAAYASAGSNNASAARNQSPGGSLTGSQWRNGGLVG